MREKVAIVTGASSGIGKAGVKKLLDEGYIVYGLARNLDNMKDIEAMGAKIKKLDISNLREVEVCVKEIIEAEGRIDILFNNAGFGLYGSVEEVSIDDALYQFQVNLFGLAKVTQLIIPQMRAQGFGKIINTSSMVGKVYFPLGAWYIASKHALEGWSDCLRLELKPFGIHVVLIQPGIIQTEFGAVMTGPMIKASGQGAYSELTQKMAKITKNSYSKKTGSSPDLIASMLIEAVKSKNPKTRYTGGELAKPMIFIRKWFGDKIYDKLIMSQIR